LVLVIVKAPKGSAARGSLALVAALLFGLALLVYPLLVLPNSRLGSLWPAGIATQFVITGTITLSPDYPTRLYAYFVGQPLLTHMIAQLLQADIASIARYAPLVLVTFIILLGFATFALLDEAHSGVVAATATSILALFQWHSQVYFSPQLVGLALLNLLYLLILIRLRKGDGSVSTPVIILLLSVAVSITHPLTAAFGLFLLLFQSVLRRQRPVSPRGSTIPVISYACLFAAYVVYAGWSSLEVYIPIISEWYRDPSRLLYALLWGRQSSIRLAGYALVFWSRATFFLIAAAFYAYGLLLAFRHSEYREAWCLSVASLLSAFLVTMVPYTGESLERGYLLSALPAAFWGAKWMGKRHPLVQVSVFLAMVILFQVAYLNNKPYARTDLQDLAGARFVAQSLPLQAVIYTEVPGDVLYFNPSRSDSAFYFLYTEKGVRTFDWSAPFSVLVSSDRERSMYQYAARHGYPVDRVEARMDFSKIYANKSYNVYLRLTDDR